MFERYTEKARRTIFFGRYEASQFGSPYIETEHLLLGLLREDKALAHRFSLRHSSIDDIRKQIEAFTTVREQVSTSVDLPLSNECKRVLAHAAEEAGRLSHKHIGTEHLLLGILRESNCAAALILKDFGITLENTRERIAAAGPSPVSPPVGTVTYTRTGSSMEFTCGNAILASVSVRPDSPVPRVGEQVVLPTQSGENHSYRVVNVTYIYERAVPVTTLAHELTRVILEIKRE